LRQELPISSFLISEIISIISGRTGRKKGFLFDYFFLGAAFFAGAFFAGAFVAGFLAAAFFAAAIGKPPPTGKGYNSCYS